jgi:hypothetical protein
MKLLGFIASAEQRRVNFQSYSCDAQGVAIHRREKHHVVLQFALPYKAKPFCMGLYALDTIVDARMLRLCRPKVIASSANHTCPSSTGDN